ncbi:MAG: response regulator [Cyanobacteria bacterium P01_F01_bin.86]
MNDNHAKSLKGHILVVDDVPENVQLLSSTLSAQGYKVRGVLSGEMALRASDSVPDLILLDIMMPGMDGYEVCRRLKASPQTCDIPVIFLSAIDDVANKVKAFTTGGVDYITKPFQIEEVIARVNHYLQLYHLQRQLNSKMNELSNQNAKLQEEICNRKLVEEALRNAEIKEREKTQQLSQTLVQLKQAQIQLIQQEKMSSLGQLVAGIAHEINNPVTFIYSNLKFAEDHVKNLLNALQLYRQATPHLPPRLQENLDELGADFIQEDFPKLLNSMNMGAKRICDIVQSLRTFSHQSKAEIKSVDVHEGIDSTLMILQGQLKAQAHHRAIEVVKEYGELPLVECYPGELNQVFMNILVNAIHALDDLRNVELNPPSEQTPKIYIQTKMLAEERVGFYIKDNGPGISKEVQSRLFEPFFTTKEIGKGTGLGLSLSYQIVVERHHGDLRCLSVPGKGSMFVIEIPTSQTS